MIRPLLYVRDVALGRWWEGCSLPRFGGKVVTGEAERNVGTGINVSECSFVFWLLAQVKGERNLLLYA
jgi:hypothetical protein